MVSGVSDILKLSYDEASQLAAQELWRAVEISPESIDWGPLQQKFETICGSENKGSNLFYSRFFYTVIRFSQNLSNRSPDNLEESYGTFLSYGDECPEGTLGKARSDIRKKYQEWVSHLESRIFYLAGFKKSEKLADLKNIKAQVDKLIGALERGFFKEEELFALSQIVGKLDDREEDDRKLAIKLLGLIGWSEKDGHPFYQYSFAKTVDEKIGHRRWRQTPVSPPVSAQVQATIQVSATPQDTTSAPVQELVPPSSAIQTDKLIASMIGSLELEVPDVQTIASEMPPDRQYPILESIAKLDKNPKAQRITLGLLNMISLDIDGKTSFPPHFEKLLEMAQNFDPDRWKSKLYGLYKDNQLDIAASEPIESHLEDILAALLASAREAGDRPEDEIWFHFLLKLYAYRDDRSQYWGDISKDVPADYKNDLFTRLANLRTMSLLLMLDGGKDHFVRDVLYMLDNENVPIGFLDLLVHATASQELTDERMIYAEFVLTKLKDWKSAPHHLALYIRPLLEPSEGKMMSLAIESGKSMDTYFEDYYKRKLASRWRTPSGGSSSSPVAPPQSTPPTPSAPAGSSNTTASSAISGLRIFAAGSTNGYSIYTNSDSGKDLESLIYSSFTGIDLCCIDTMTMSGMVAIGSESLMPFEAVP